MNTTTRSLLPRSRSSLTALAGALALATAVSSASPLQAPANAESPASSSGHQRAGADKHRVVHHDARGDVVEYNVRSGDTRPAPRDRTSDVTRTVVDHRAHRLVVQARMGRLSRSGYRLLVAEIRTAGGERFDLSVDYSTKPIDRRVIMTNSGTGREVRCPGASWSLSRSANRVTASVPDSCLGGPAWVRVGVGLIASPYDVKTSRADDSRTRGHVGEHLTLGPRQPRA